MMLLKEILQRAGREHWSTGHFNVSELDHIRAIVEVCSELAAPAMIGTSEGERTHIGLTQLVALRSAFGHDFPTVPIFLNADHTKSVENAKKAVDAGYDSIHIDLSAKLFDENVAGTKEIVAYARAKDPDISVEGELGYLKGESKVQHEKITVSKDDYTKPEEAEKFVQETGVDRLAIVVGNIHGISLEEPDLDIERIREIRAIIPESVAIVLHAGSGIPDDQIRAAIEAGIANIHINTDLRVAFIDGLKKGISDHPDEAAMYKIDAEGVDAMKNILKEKLMLFGSANRIN
ncbi:MAG: class II fructose-bisphosphate aldolase [bacterium]|nr:class II fructose-bisphosphate aldolase [bacterium]